LLLCCTCCVPVAKTIRGRKTQAAAGKSNKCNILITLQQQQQQQKISGIN